MWVACHWLPPDRDGLNVAAMRALLPLLLLVAGCASAPGEWPSLTRRPGTAASDCNAGATAEPAAAQSPAPAPPAATLDAATLVAREAALDAVLARWARERADAEAAVSRAQGRRPDDAAWSTAQLHISRLTLAGAEIAEERDRLAAQSDAAGGPADVVTSAQRLLERAEAAHQAHLGEVERLRRLLQ
jgi:hypothetical protein